VATEEALPTAAVFGGIGIDVGEGPGRRRQSEVAGLGGIEVEDLLPGGGAGATDLAETLFEDDGGGVRQGGGGGRRLPTGDGVLDFYAHDLASAC